MKHRECELTQLRVSRLLNRDSVMLHAEMPSVQTALETLVELQESNGVITNGNEIVVRAAVKPTPSIGREQNTYNLATDKVEPLTIRGRHDVCVALRGAVVAEAAVAIALANLIRH